MMKEHEIKVLYVFQYYRPGEAIYHFTNLTVGTNLQLETIPSKNSSKVRYFFHYSKHERIIETIIFRSDPDGLPE
jgi:hypothetical protein